MFHPKWTAQTWPVCHTQNDRIILSAQFPINDNTIINAHYIGTSIRNSPTSNSSTGTTAIADSPCTFRYTVRAPYVVCTKRRAANYAEAQSATFSLRPATWAQIIANNSGSSIAKQCIILFSPSSRCPMIYRLDAERYSVAILRTFCTKQWVGILAGTE